jgi:hypothetical protein
VSVVQNGFQVLLTMSESHQLSQEAIVMKALICAALAAAALAVPAISFAQSSNSPVTRAEVRADLVRLEAAGYHPGVNDIHYPAGIQAAEARVQGDDSHAEYGGSADDRAAGATPIPIQRHSLYSGH